MRVLTISNHFPPLGYIGGAEIAACNTISGLLRRGVDCSVLVVNNRFPRTLDEWHVYNDIPVHYIGWAPDRRSHWQDVFDRRIYNAVRTELARLHPDLVHVHNVSGSTLAPYVACRSLGIPVANTLHDMWLLCPSNMCYREGGLLCDLRESHSWCRGCFQRYDFWGAVPGRRLIFAALTSNVRTFIAPSRSLIRQHVSAGYAERRFTHVAHGIDLAVSGIENHAKAEILRAESRLFPTLIYAGGGFEIKGASVLLDALPLIARYVRGVRAIVAGFSGEDRIRARFARYVPLVKLMAWLPPNEILSLFRAADLVIVPSTWMESFSLVTLHGLQMGTPVVASALGAMQELICDGETGYLFPAGDSGALAEKVINHFARAPHERRLMRRACIARAESSFSLESHLDRIVDVYQNLVGR